MNDRPLELHELTAGEKARVAWLMLRMARECASGTATTRGKRLMRECDRILDKARKRADAVA
jgi:hypothetical protein